ncbi:MAG: hypothetical protein AAFN41_06765 [Planctomycetota bacterium]
MNARRPEPGDSLAKAPDVQGAYTDAQKATTPLEPATPGPDTSRTSAAQKYDPIQALSAREEQIQAAKPSQPEHEAVLDRIASRDQQQPERGSQMVREQQPTPRPSNDTEVGRVVDANTFNDRWNQEQARANGYQEMLNRAAAGLDDQQQHGQEHGQGQDISR